MIFKMMTTIIRLGDCMAWACDGICSACLVIKLCCRTPCTFDAKCMSVSQSLSVDSPDES